jgi:hypothetical protein
MKPEYQDFEGHRIEIRGPEDKPELLIDNVTVACGRLPDGKFFLHDYAYDWTDDLFELARRYVTYRRNVEDVRAKSAPQKGR